MILILALTEVTEKVLVNMKLETKKKLARSFLKLVHPIYKGGLAVRHNGVNHYIMRVSKLKFKSTINKSK